MSIKRTIFVFAAAGLAGAFAVTPQEAHADALSCPQPTLSQCKSPAYLETECGKLQDRENSACDALLRAAFDADTQTLPAASITQVMQPDKPGTAVPAARPAYAFAGHGASGLDIQVAGTTQRAQLLTLVGVDPVLVGDPGNLAQLRALKQARTEWEQNGNRVGSCAETVYERFYDWTKFMDAVDAFGPDDGRVVDAAFAPTTGIAGKTLRSKSGARTLPTVTWPSNGKAGSLMTSSGTQVISDPKAPKNDFFGAYKTLNEKGFFGAADTALRDKLRSGYSHWLIDWNWHLARRSDLSTRLDEELRYWNEKQIDFAGTVARWAAAADAVRAGDVLRTADRDSLAEQIRRALETADQAGCLSTAGTSVCDWSPRRFRAALESHFAQHMGPAYQLCVDYTGDDFAALRAPAADLRPTKPDYTVTAEDVEGYYKLIENFIRAQSYPVKPDGSKELGGGKADSGKVGSGDVNLVWSYDVGWGADGLKPDAPTCEVNLHAHGDFSATGNAFGLSKELVAAHVDVGSNKDSARFSQYMRVVGKDLWTPTDWSKEAKRLEWSFVATPKHKESASFGKTIPVFGIPVRLEGGISVLLGADISASANVLPGRCEVRGNTREVILASATGSLNPYVQADAFASVGVGWSWLKAGAKCDLTVIRGDMPVKADASLRLTSTGTVRANVAMNARQKFRMLDGQISVYFDAPIDSLDREKTIFSWEGPRIDEELYAFNKSLPLDLMKR
jgi:hypothetical protein